MASFPASSQQARLYDLSHLGLIAVSGEDALTFLQGQFTNDIKQVVSGAQFTGYCTAKGRLLALFYAFSLDHVIYLQCPRALVATLVKRLRMFVLRSKVVIEDVSDRFVALGVSAPALNAHAVIAGIAHDTHQLGVTGHGHSIRLSDSAGQQRALLWLEANIAQSAWTALAGSLHPTSTAAWEAFEVQAGIPQVYASTQEQFVPQMVNMDALNGINFKKGCYTGQEIVARTHYLGKVKRRSLLATIAHSDTAPKAGDVVFDAQQQEAGQLVRVAPRDQGWVVLAECRLEAREAGTITWQGQALQFSELPYALP